MAATVNTYPVASTSVTLTDPLALRTYRAAGLTALGLTSADNYAEDFEDYIKSGPIGAVSGAWTVSTASTGTFGVPSVIKGTGSFTMTTGTSASGLIYAQSGSTSNNAQVENVKTTKWYFAWRGAIVTAIDGQALLADGLVNVASNKTVLIGFNGKASASNFSISYDAYYNGTPSAVDLGVAFDNVAHVFEMWCDGAGNLRGRVDGGAISAPGAQGGSAPADGLKRSLWNYNGTTAAARVCDRDWAYLLTARVS